MNTKMASESTPLSKSPKPCGSLVTSEAYEEAMKHLMWLASMRATKEHAWYRAKKLDKDTSGLYKGIAQDLVNRMKQNAPPQE